LVSQAQKVLCPPYARISIMDLNSHYGCVRESFCIGHANRKGVFTDIRILRCARKRAVGGLPSASLDGVFAENKRSVFRICCTIGQSVDINSALCGVIAVNSPSLNDGGAFRGPQTCVSHILNHPLPELLLPVIVIVT
jgi:hypothetical protein